MFIARIARAITDIPIERFPRGNVGRIYEKTRKRARSPTGDKSIIK